MRVLWFTNIPLSEAGITGSGGWMPALATALLESTQINLCSVSHKLGNNIIHKKEGSFEEWIFPVSNPFQTSYSPSTQMISNCQDAIDCFNPDIIHIHGTEQYFGLLTGRKSILLPSVISIQGLIHVIQHYVNGGLTLSEQIKMSTIRDWYRWDGPIQKQLRIKSISKYELEILKLNKNFIGRTRWDQAHILAINPNANYYHCDELLRKSFYKAQWNSNKFVPHTILISSIMSPLKGAHWVLRAAAILQHKYKDIEIRIIGSKPSNSWLSPGYQHWIISLIHELGLDNNVTWLGNLDQIDISFELEKVNVCIIGSLIENSSNFLSEAMITGTPLICSYAGGNPSMVQDMETALCYPPCDSEMLAACISILFDDKDLAEKFSNNEKRVALKRHDPKVILNTMLSIYQDVIDNYDK